MLGEEAAREVQVLGRDPHLAVVLDAERGRHVVEIGHAVHVDPGLRHRHDHIGVAEAERLDEHHLGVGIGHLLAHEVLAGDAEMHRALREQLGDFAGRQIGDLDAGHALDRAAIVALAARLDELEPGAREERVGVLLQPALGGDRDDEGAAHDGLPQATSRSIHTPSPTAGIGVALPSRLSSLS